LPKSTHTNKTKVALLTTGDELINGDISNLNAQHLAARLFAADIPVGLHLSVGDDSQAIHDTLSYLAEQHAALIITGGLGPTRDDLTRYALSTYLEQPLVIHQKTLEALTTRLKQYNLAVTSNNRQQALFPRAAQVIPNLNGTAAGCLIEQQNCLFIMLPGPPHENLPMFEAHVLPALAHLQQSNLLFKSWFVFAMAESVLADLIDGSLRRHTSKIGYRYHYPYIEIKGFFKTHADIQSAQADINQILAKHDRQLLQETGTSQLARECEHITKPIQITDHVTGGRLAKQILTPKNHKNINFHQSSDPRHYLASFTLTGLDTYWQQNAQDSTTLTLSSETNSHQCEIPLRGKSTLKYATELAAFLILQNLANI
jgi:molybdenum cofactor synthesis domain-containing protein